MLRVAAIVLPLIADVDLAFAGAKLGARSTSKKSSRRISPAVRANYAGKVDPTVCPER
jgi:hypothetical protein